MQAFCVPRDFTTAQGTTLDARRARYLAKIAIGWLLPLSKVPTATMKLDQVQPPQAYSVEIDATRLIDAAHPTGPHAVRSQPPPVKLEPKMTDQDVLTRDINAVNPTVGQTDGLS